jgi:hypothetical protein
MVIQINVKNPENLKKGDILIYNGENFDTITKEYIIKEIKQDVEEMKITVQNISHSFKNTKDVLKKKQNNFFKAFLRGEKL